MNSSLQVAPSLFISVLVNARGDRRAIVAMWLEDADPGYRPRFVALTIGQDGYCLKIDLPNEDWKFVSKFGVNA